MLLSEHAGSGNSKAFRGLILLATALTLAASLGLFILLSRTQAGAAPVVAIPVLFVLPAALASSGRGARIIALLAAVALSGFWFLAILSIGWFYMPAVLSLWGAGYVEAWPRRGIPKHNNRLFGLLSLAGLLFLGFLACGFVWRLARPM